MHRQLLKRQNFLTAPSLPSVSGASTATVSASGSNLVINSASSSLAYSAPPLASGGVVVTSIVPVASSVAPSVSAGAGSGTSSSSSSSSKFPLSTVIGICVGTFVAAGLLICFSVWFYRRSNDRSARKALSRPVRRRERRETWNPLRDDQDRWEGKTRDVEKAGLEKSPGALKKMPSQAALVQTFASTGASDTSSQEHDDNPFAAYHPNLAAELAQPPKAFLGHKEGFGSWDGSTTVVSADDSYASLKTVHIESGQMSPSVNPAKMTPPTTTSIHRWESAEIVHPGGNSDFEEPTQNPFVDKPQQIARNKSHSNPFFGAQETRQKKVARKNSEQAQDPFTDKHAFVADPAADSIPRISHSQTDSVASDSSAFGADRAMQSLINALNLPQEEVEKRLRIASMQQSEMSRYSYLTSDSVYEPSSPVFPERQ